MKKITAPTKVELKHLYIDLKYTISQLADHYGCSVKPIKKWLKEYKITKSEEQRLQAAKATCLKKYGTSTPFESKSLQDKAQKTLHKLYANPKIMQSIQHKREESFMNKYGVINPGQLQSTKEKVRETSRRLYGKDYYMQTEEYKQRIIKTNLSKRGVPFVMQSEGAKLKSRNTCLNNYGVDNYAKSQESKNKYKNPQFVKDIVDKQYLTRKQNHTFKISKPENICYDLLLTKYNKEDIKRQYKSELYPFNCDFYIKPLDLYIECNFFWMHGSEPFNKDNPKHIEKLSLWKSKNSESFNNAIETWTVRDTAKLETFKKNNLNYKIFYKFSEFKDWFENV